jgi:hypothetical protein
MEERGIGRSSEFQKPNGMAAFARVEQVFADFFRAPAAEATEACQIVPVAQFN